MCYCRGVEKKDGGDYHGARTLLEAARSLQEQSSKNDDLANTYLTLASVHCSLGDTASALVLYDKAILIQEDISSPLLAETYTKTASLYHDSGDLTKALSLYEKALDKQKDDPLRSNLYQHIASIYDGMGDSDGALSNYQKAQSILENGVKGLELAKVYHNIAWQLEGKGDFDGAHEMNENALSIRAGCGPHGEDMAESYEAKSRHEERCGNIASALTNHLAALSIHLREWVPLHPRLPVEHNRTAELMIRLQRYSEALSHADKAILADTSFKVPYHTKGMALFKLGRIQDAVSCFNTALEKDSGYADALISKMEALEEVPVDTLWLEEELTSALIAKEKLRPTDYNATYVLRMAAAAKALHVDLSGTFHSMSINEKYHAGEPTSNAALKERVAVLEDLLEATQKTVKYNEERICAVEERVTATEVAQAVFEGELLGLRWTQDTMQQAVEDAEHTLTDLVLRDAHRLEAEETLRKVEDFNANADLRHFYGAVSSELAAAFSASVALHSGEISKRGDRYESIFFYARQLTSLVPLVGQLVAIVITRGAKFIRNVENGRRLQEVERLLDLNLSPLQHSNISVRVGVLLTERYYDKIVALKGEKVPNGLFDRIKDDGMLGAFIKKNETIAKVQGRLAALEIINNLMEEAVAENLCVQRYRQCPADVDKWVAEQFVLFEGKGEEEDEEEEEEG